MTGTSEFLPEIIVSSTSVKVKRAWLPRVMIRRCRLADHCHNTGQWLACAASALADAASSCIIKRSTREFHTGNDAPTAKYYSFALSRDASSCLSIWYPTVAATAIQRATDATAADAREPAVRDRRASQISKGFGVFPLTRRVSSGVRWILIVIVAVCRWAVASASALVTKITDTAGAAVRPWRHSPAAVSILSCDHGFGVSSSTFRESWCLDFVLRKARK